MKFNVPYHSQFIEVQDSFWNIRSCGATCLQMVAEFHGKQTPSLIELCEEAKEKGGYDMTNGWVHDYLVTKAKELGLEGYRKEGLISTYELKASLNAGNPVIVSVEKKVLEQTRFHLIILVGYESTQTLEIKENTSDKVSDLTTGQKSQTNDCIFFYHDPEATTRENGIERRCSEEIFMNYWRGKAIFISK